MDIIVTIILSTILHFLYEFSGGNFLVALFSAVNESVWEHIKIVVMATYLVFIAKLWILENRKCNLWTSIFYKVIAIIILIPLGFYSYLKVTKVEILPLDILIAYGSIIISEFVEYFIQSKMKVSSKVEDIYKYLSIFIIIIFMLFTFIQPNIGIFKYKAKIF